MSANDFTSVITDMIAQDMMTHFKDLMKRVLFSFTSELSKTHKISVEEVILIWNKALPHLAYEVHMPVKETKVSPSSDDEEETVCQFVLTRGKNKGETCGKKNVKDSHFCATHNKKPQEPENKEQKSEKEPENKEQKSEKEPEKEKSEKENENKEEKSCECKYILTRGKNKGEKCGKKTVKDAHYCATHNKKEESDSESEKENEKKQRKRKDKTEEQIEKVEKVEEKVEKVEKQVDEKVEEKKEEKVEEKVVENEKVEEKKENKKYKKKEVNKDDIAKKAKQLEEKLNEQKQKEENDLKLKKVEKEKKNIGVDMAKNILQNLEKKEDPVSISVLETQTQNADIEEDDDDEDSFTYEQCKKQILINPKLNKEGELEFFMTKKNLEKFINKKMSSSEEQYKVSVNIFNNGMNIFYEEDGKKEQKKLLKFRFNKYHSVINDYLSSL